MHRLCGTLMKWLSWVKQGVKVYGIVILVIRFSIPVEVGMASRVIMSTVNNRDRAEQIARVLIVLPISNGSLSYLSWIGASVRPQEM